MQYFSSLYFNKNNCILLSCYNIYFTKSTMIISRQYCIIFAFKNSTALFSPHKPMFFIQIPYFCITIDFIGSMIFDEFHMVHTFLKLLNVHLFHTLYFSKAILWINLIKFIHHSISFHFSNNGSCCNRSRFCITFNY